MGLQNLTVSRSILATVMSLAACSGYAQTQTASHKKVAPQMKALADASNAFAVDLYHQLAKQEKGNLFFSPTSIHTVLGMVYAGAAGNTEAQMQRTLHLEQRGDKAVEAYAELLKALNTPETRSDGKPVYELVVSNALWPARTFALQPAYQERMKQAFNVTLTPLDYTKEAEARQTINDAVAKDTQNRIKELIQPGFISSQTRMVLTNAIYFKSRWGSTFDEHFTKKALFQLPGSKKVHCQMMNQTAYYDYLETPQMQLLNMPYLNDELSMVVLLPKKIEGLAPLERCLSAQQLNTWMAQAKNVKVKVAFPKFTFENQFLLGRTLKALGMAEAFGEKADFSGIAKGEKIYLSDAVHKAFVAVDEGGTEAAAATAVGTYGCAMPVKEKIYTFRANRPFLFFIRHNTSGALLFAGRLNTPAAK